MFSRVLKREYRYKLLCGSVGTLWNWKEVSSKLQSRQFQSFAPLTGVWVTERVWMWRWDKNYSAASN
jgi:hypothetical protein